MDFWHGGKRWTERPAVQPPKKGRCECGPGIYLTTSYGTARNTYARGNNVTTLVSLKDDITWLERTELPLQVVLDYVRTTRGFRKRDQILADLENRSFRRKQDVIPVEYLVNLCVNYDALSGNQGIQLAEWLVEQGIDASLHSRGAGEQWVIVFNPRIIERYRVVLSAQVSLEQYTLPLVNLPARP
jgi:hypothetical protein